MVHKSNIKNNEKYALISVYDKRNLKEICLTLNKFNIKIISTGSTAEKISELGFKSDSVSKLTKFKEIFDGRVKTLHPKIHSSLLFKRNDLNHAKIFKQLKFPIIDFVIVNLYPFKKVIKNSKNIEECIEMIDVGGSTLLRSSAKNFQFVTTISKVSDYDRLIKELNINKGKTSLKFRKKMAQNAFGETAKYDKLINESFINYSSIKKNIKLRYGENPNQKAFYKFQNIKKTFFNYQIHGKKISYNNILDIDAGINCLLEFNLPTCVIIKHNNPCAVASDNKIIMAYKKSFLSDPISSFGGVVILNRSINTSLAKELYKKFYEVIVAKSFNNTAKKILMKRKNLILIETKKLIIDNKKEFKSVNGGFVVQNKNLIKISKQNIYCANKHKLHTKILNDLIFAYKVCKHVKSNAIILAKNLQTIGIGAGQMSRVDSTIIAINKKIKNINNYVAASDGFFPFNDSIKKLHQNKCKAIIQPMGSKNDKKAIEYTNSIRMPLYFTKYRLFKH